MSDTPETDSHVFDATYADDKGDVVPADICRKLERERNEARRGFERMSDTCFAAIRRAEKAEKARDAARRFSDEYFEIMKSNAERAEKAEKERDSSHVDCHQQFIIAMANKAEAEKQYKRAEKLDVELAASKEQLAAERKRADVPSGYCVAPLEPTDKMAQAAWDIQTDPQPQAVKAMYRAMIKARSK